MNGIRTMQIEQIEIDSNDDFEFDLTEIGLLDYELNFEKNEESNELEIFIFGNNEVYLIEDLIGDSLTSTEGKILFINSEQKEILNNLLTSLFDTNKIEKENGTI